MRILNQLKMLKVISWCLIPNTYHNNLMGYKRGIKRLFYQPLAHILGWKISVVSIAHDHTAHILGQGVEGLENTMYVYLSSQRPFAGTSLAMGT